MAEKIEEKKDDSILRGMMIAELLLKAAALLGSFDDTKNKNKVLDIAEFYCNKSEDKYMANLDSSVIDIINDVKKELSLED